MTITEQLKEILWTHNFDDRDAKLGDRTRDKAGAALEGMGLTRDRIILRGTLRGLPRNDFRF